MDCRKLCTYFSRRLKELKPRIPISRKVNIFVVAYKKIRTEVEVPLIWKERKPSVYKGICGNGVLVAVKVLNGSSDKRIEEQLKAKL
ncbi:hypothetical protein C1H46_010786 [Malus baccata]|uniref:Uncharacterized protein n=1 Tax=Malus baccata TaxID=106549 RepID=A0A540MXX9_MALBA|nr:hypothetical protein C1H46_010786 [Malus baccata]